jgi:hypothetical protein
MPATARRFHISFSERPYIFKEVETEKTSGYNAIKAIYQLLALLVGLC